MLWEDVWQGVVGQKVWILAESARQSFFSAPAAPFLASRNAATYEDSIILGVAAGPRGNPGGPVGICGNPRRKAGPVFTGALWIHGRY